MKKTAAIYFAMAAAAIAGDGTSLSGRFMIWPQWAYSKTAGVATVTAGFPQQLVNYSTTDGTNDYQMTALVVRTIELSGLSTNTVNLLTETNAFGDAVVFSRVNLLCAASRTNSSGDVLMGGAAVGPFVDIFGDVDAALAKIRPGGSVVFAAPVGGYVPGSGVLQFVTDSTNAATVDIYIGGVAE